MLALKSLYNALVVPHLNYGLKLWGIHMQTETGAKQHAAFLIQKRAIRVITRNKFFSHTSPIFKENKLLKLPDMYKIQCLKLHYKIERDEVPFFYRSFTLRSRDIHDHNTRHRNQVRPTGSSSKWLRHYLPRLITATPPSLLANISSTTIHTFSRTCSSHYINAYETVCTKTICLPCGKTQLL